MTTPNVLALSAITPKLLASMQLAAGDNAAYTVPANKAAKFATGCLCNTSGSAVTVSVSIIPSGGSVDGTHRIVSGYSLAAGDTLSLAEYLSGMLLGAGDAVSVNAGTGSAVDVTLSGTEMS